MSSKSIHSTISILLLIGFGSVIILSISQLTTGNVCPPVLGIPACYILLVLISLVIISHLRLIKDRNILFFIGSGITWLIAIYASFNQMYDLLECPKEPVFGIPMCYLSFLLFGGLIILKIVEIKTKVRS